MFVQFSKRFKNLYKILNKMSLKENECTVVTAYYELKNKKHSSASYHLWIANFMTFDCYMVIFTGDEETKAKLLTARNNFLEKTRVIILPLDSLFCSRFIDYWKKDYDRDHERYHTPLLYILWNEKTAFLKRAKDVNLFNTEYYCWADIGMVRHETYLDYTRTFPSKKMLETCNKSKVYLLNLVAYTEEEKQTITDACEHFRYKNNTGAGVILCHQNLVDQWFVTYYTMMQRFMELDLFAGKDQSIINCVCLIHKDLVQFIVPQNSPIDEWFYMLVYFSDYFYNKHFLVRG